MGPDSSYSPLEIHICWNVLNDDKIEPPIQTEYLRSGGATTLIFIVEGARAVNSFVMRSPMPLNMVVPPEKMLLTRARSEGPKFTTYDTCRTTWNDLGRPGPTWDDLGRPEVTQDSLGRLGTTWSDLRRAQRFDFVATETPLGSGFECPTDGLLDGAG